MMASTKNTARAINPALMLEEFGRDESGATSIEYGLIVALIFLAIVGAIRSYTETTSGMYGEITDTLQTATD